MKKVIFFFSLLAAMTAYAQSTPGVERYIIQEDDIVGKWFSASEGVNGVTYTFKADGTKSMSGENTATYPIGGVYVNFNMVQDRTDETWKIQYGNIKTTAIPLTFKKFDIEYEKYSSNLTAAQKQRVRAALPAFKNSAMAEAKRDWQQKMVGKSFTLTVNEFTPQKMRIDGNRVLVRDTINLSAGDKAAYEASKKRYAAYLKEVAIAEEKAREAERQRAEAEAERKRAEAEAERQKAEAERKRLQAIEDAYWAGMGAEKTESGKRAEAEGVKAVDLGLSVRWASANIGAATPNDIGNYYAWGEVETKKDYYEDTYKVKTKYKKNMTLIPEDDAATQHWGVGWHIPTIAQWQELFDKCKFEEIEDSNTWYVKVTGPNGNSIIIPFHRGKPTNGYYASMEGEAPYWTNCCSKDSKSRASCAVFFSKKRTKKKVEKSIVDQGFKFYNPRYCGLPVRAVIE